MTHVLKGRLKGVVEKAKREKAIKKVVKSTIEKKTWEIVVMEKKDVAVEKDWDFYQWKVDVFEGKLEDTNT